MYPIGVGRRPGLKFGLCYLFSIPFIFNGPHFPHLKKLDKINHIGLIG